jgi:hypothetical protein
VREHGSDSLRGFTERIFICHEHVTPYRAAARKFLEYEELLEEWLRARRTRGQFLGIIPSLPILSTLKVYHWSFITQLESQMTHDVNDIVRNREAKGIRTKPRWFIPVPIAFRRRRL